MPLDSEFLQMLACPGCRGELVPTPDETELRCERCRLAFRIDDGIPILLLDEATRYE